MAGAFAKAMKPLIKSVKLPEIFTPKPGASDTRWFIYFSCLHPITGKMQRVKKYDDLNRFSPKERPQRAKELRDFYRRKLRNGWDPFQDLLKYVYKEAEPEPTISISAQTTIPEHLFNVLREQRRRLRPGTFRTYQSQIRLVAAWLKQTDNLSLPLGAFKKEYARTFK
ncbi:MAG: hypothetical protein LH606_05195 [Cytophagaceae bacterium]|nr:hypothetical protein [Cytophagaceae bacterium]